MCTDQDPWPYLSMPKAASQGHSGRISSQRMVHCYGKCRARIGLIRSKWINLTNYYYEQKVSKVDLSWQTEYGGKMAPGSVILCQRVCNPLPQSGKVYTVLKKSFGGDGGEKRKVRAVQGRSLLRRLRFLTMIALLCIVSQSCFEGVQPKVHITKMTSDVDELPNRQGWFSQSEPHPLPLMLSRSTGEHREFTIFRAQALSCYQL
jgi:hypothetical protein